MREHNIQAFPLPHPLKPMVFFGICGNRETARAGGEVSGGSSGKASSTSSGWVGREVVRFLRFRSGEDGHGRGDGDEEGKEG